ncbi:hypothetical protein [Corynebacterium sp. 335C]
MAGPVVTHLADAPHTAGAALAPHTAHTAGAVLADAREVLLVAQNAAVGGRAALTYLLFIIAGLLVGGAWSAYKAGSTAGTLVAGLLAVVALGGAILWLLGGMG